MNLDNARIWLTGASSGIGEALVAPLVQSGARLALTARRQDRLEEIARTNRRPDRELLVLPADVTDRDAMHRVVGAIERQLGGIDLAVLNAGTGRRIRVESFNATDFVEVFRTNLFGPIYGLEALLPSMLARRSGRIAVVASLAGYMAAPTLAGYGTSKAALIHAFDSIRFDLAPHGIAVTVINPGFVRTSMNASSAFWRPGIMDVDRAAAMIVRGLARDRKEIYFPAWLALTLKALRLLPAPLFDRLVTIAVKR
jgi:short-subunit dehydrogenase